MELEAIVIAYKELTRQIDALEEKKKALSEEIIRAVPLEAKSVRVADYVVRRYSRLSIKTSLEVARVLDAVKMEETVDKEKIKQIYLQGEAVPDVKEIQYINVSAARPAAKTDS